MCVLDDGDRIDATAVVSAVAPDLTLNTLVTAGAVDAGLSARLSGIDHRGSYLQMHFALDGVPEFAAPYEFLNDPKMQSAIGIFTTPEELQRQCEDCRRGIVPADPAIALQIPSVYDPDLAPPGKHAASAFSLWFPVEEDPAEYARLKAEMGQRVIDKITRFAPNFESLILKHTTFTPKHMGTMFGAPGGDYCHGLIHPDQIGPVPARARGVRRPAARRSRASTSAAPAATAARASPSSPATTPPRRCSRTASRPSLVAELRPRWSSRWRRRPRGYVRRAPGR